MKTRIAHTNDTDNRANTVGVTVMSKNAERDFTSLENYISNNSETIKSVGCPEEIEGEYYDTFASQWGTKGEFMTEMKRLIREWKARHLN